ncbi:uncharacterized protein LOC124433313 [Xenia sp. Carnegie-2017]|uniref:uncharacterized protein LOC124433313 n=1 Tax=Xenia sp. Carnegie-2017 TaxID=2897299 RepID=UPI001F049F9A|nr:uncharacterized protein LOC124433313 [Xenia sp. Carnegie-2017]
MNVVLILNCEASNKKAGLTQAQNVLRQLCENGNKVSIFECKEQSVKFMSEEPASLLTARSLDKRLHTRMSEADATLLITDKSATDCPSYVRKVKSLDKTVYVWNSGGINCILLGGSIHSRQAAMQLHAILEERNYYPYMANVLPRQCSWHNMYRVDPSMETAGPCVL